MKKTRVTLTAACLAICLGLPAEGRTPDNPFETAVWAVPENSLDKVALPLMEKAGFALRPCSSDTVFIRRVYLDLAGTTPTAEEVEAFLRAVEAIPTGKQNTFAAHNPPSFRLAVARAGGFAWSLTNAFEKPVHPRGDSGLVAPSVAAVETYWAEQLLAVYGKDSVKQVALLAPGLELTTLKDARVADLAAWIDAIMESLPKEG